MTTSRSPRSSGPVHPTRQQLDELDALLQRMLDLPVNHLEDAQPPPAEEPAAPEPASKGAEEPVEKPAEPDAKPPLLAVFPASLVDRGPPVAYTVVETTDPRPESAREPAAAPEAKGEGPGDWIPLKSSWRPSAQTWGPLAEKWQQAQGALEPAPAPPEEAKTIEPVAPEPAPAVSAPPSTEPVAERPAPAPEVPPPAAPTPAPAADHPPVPKKPAAPPAPRPEPRPPKKGWGHRSLVGFNKVFYACLWLLGPAGSWLAAPAGRTLLGVVGLMCLGAAAVLFFLDGVGLWK
jgi:hypothetical protein